MPQVRVGWRAYVPTTYPTDTDAQTFITAAAITSTEQQTAINTLVNELKLCGVWNKMKAIYPFVGGTAHAHKFNLKDPRDVDAAFRLQFSGGWTHSATGAYPNGINAYADTKLTPLSHLLTANHHYSYYSRSNDAPLNEVEIGTANMFGYYSAHMRIRLHGYYGVTNKFTIALNSSNVSVDTSYTNTDSRGFYQGQITSTSSRKLYKNGANVANVTQNSPVDSAPYRVYIGALSEENVAKFFSRKESAFASIGDGMTDAEASCYYSAVQKFQTMLNRQIGAAVMPAGQVEQLLETYSGSAIAYSTRKIRSGYSGSAIRVRRSSDNAEQNIGFTAAGDLDTAALLAFTGTSNGFVTKWYDQSGNGRDCIQATAALQPQISMNGIVFTERGRPTIASTGASLLSSAGLPMTNAQLTSFALFRMISTRKNMFLGNFGGAHVSPSRSGTGNNRFFGTTTGDVVYTPMASGNNQFVISNNGGLISAWENGNLMVNAAPYVTADGMSVYMALFDRWGNSAPLNQGTSISEVILYNSGMTASKSAIESSAIAYFNPAYSTDSDATAFLSATGITNSTISGAINVMVKSLKSEGLWTKMKAIYPFVGGNATTHRFNLKDPRDLDAAFRLTPNGGITHDGGGAQFNGSTGWYNTNMNAANNLSVNSLHLSFYSLTNAANTYSGGEIGHVGYSSWTTPPQDPAKQLLLRVKNAQYAGSNALFISGNGYSSYSTNDGYGLTVASITSATASYIRKGYNSQYFADKSAAGATNTGTLPAYNICIGKTQGYGEYSAQKCAFASIGEGLSYDESARLYGIVQIFQISLGRQV